MQDVCSDAEMVRLVQAAKVYDSAAFGTLYQLYSDKLYHYLLYRVGNQGVAEDLTMEVFVRLLEKIKTFSFGQRRPVPAFSAWIYRIAFNLAMDYHRAHRPGRMPLPINWREVDRRPGPLERVTLGDRFERVQQAISKVSVDQQQVVILRFIEGMRAKQVAEILDKTEGAVKALQHRALVNLRQILREDSS